MQEDSLPHQTWDSKEGTWAECRSPPQPNINVTVSTHATDFEVHGHTLRRERHNLSTTALADTGCQSCLAGPLLLNNLNLRRSDLIPACLAMKSASGNSLPIMGTAPAASEFRQRETRQMVYFSPLASKLYLSLSTCQDLGLVSSAFPLSTAAASSKETPPEHSTQTRSNHPSAPRPTPKSPSNPTPALQIKPQTPPAARLPRDTRQRPCSCPTRAPPPDKPTTLPFPGTIDNRHKLEHYLLDLYSASAFNVYWRKSPWVRP